MKKILLFLIFITGFAFADPAQQDFEKRLDTAFKNVMESTNKNSATYSKNPEELYKLLDKELGNLFDFSLITKRITGKYYKEFTHDELVAFEGYFKYSLFSNFEDFLINPQNLKDFKNSTSYKLGHFTNSQSNPKKATQNVSLKYKDTTYNLVLSLFKKENRWIGENIILDNLNVGLNYRNQFYVLYEKHKSMEQVMKNWKSADDLRKTTEKEMGVDKK